MSEEYGKYWICDACAKARGAIPTDMMGVTMVRGECSWCKMKMEQFLTPLRDYLWANGRPVIEETDS